MKARMIVSLVLGLVVTALVVTACVVAESPEARLRERISVDARDDAFFYNGADVIWYNDDHGTVVARIDGDGTGHIAAPTAVGTATPAFYVDSAGVSNVFELRDAGTPVWYMTGAGAIVSTGSVTTSGGQTINNWLKVAAPTAIATATPGVVVDNAGVSTLLEVRDAATPVASFYNGGDFDLHGNKIDLDADNDTSITADTDDQIDIEISAADDFQFTANMFEVLSGSAMKMNGGVLDLDADDDTSMTADTDDQIDVEISGTDEYTITGTIFDLGANQLDLDLDNDTSITADTDDQIDVEISGADDFQFTANTFTALSGSNVDFNGDLDVDGTANLDDVDVDLSASMNIDGHMLDVGTGSYTTVDGDNDLGVAGDLEVDGATDLDGTLAVAGAATFAAGVTEATDITISNDATGGNAGARSQFLGLPKISAAVFGAMTNGTTETASYMDDTPTGEWSEDDAGTNLVLSEDTSIYRVGSKSLKFTFTDVVDNDGATGSAGAQDDLSGNESIGFWIYSSSALTSGDFDVTVDDSDGTDQVYSIGAVAATTWTWIELDISGCDANCDTMDNIKIAATAQGGSTFTTLDLYVDAMYKWDSADEESLNADLVQDGVLFIWAVDTAAGNANTQLLLTEHTDFFPNYQSGDDVTVTITDQSANSGMAVVAAR